MKKDDLDYVIEALQKRDEILIKDKPVRQYNKYFNNMRKYARKMIDDGRQAELLPFLQSENSSKYGNGYVINELYSTTEAISHNGKHYAVLFNGKVYDNLFPEGIEYNKWKDGFFAISGELQISFTDF